MKGLILAVASTGVLIGVTAAGLRLYRGDKEYKVFLGGFAVSLGVYWWLFARLPAAMGFLTPALVEPSSAVDYWNGIIVLTALFHAFWVFAYAACLGPTMSLLVEMSQRADRGLTTGEALAVFGADEPLNHILRRRLPKLLKGSYLTKEGERYRLLPRGLVIARLSGFLRRLTGLTPA